MVVIVEEVGLITCERSVVGQKGQTPHSRNKGFNSEPIHMEAEVKDQEDEVEDGRDK